MQVLIDNYLDLVKHPNSFTTGQVVMRNTLEMMWALYLIFFLAIISGNLVHHVIKIVLLIPNRSQMAAYFFFEEFWSTFEYMQSKTLIFWRCLMYNYWMIYKHWKFSKAVANLLKTEYKIGSSIHSFFRSFFPRFLFFMGDFAYRKQILCAGIQLKYTEKNFESRAHKFHIPFAGMQMWWSPQLQTLQQVSLSTLYEKFQIFLLEHISDLIWENKILSYICFQTSIILWRSCCDMLLSSQMMHRIMLQETKGKTRLELAVNLNEMLSNHQNV